MPDFLPVPPTSSVTDAQTRAVLDALSQNIQVAIEKFAATGNVATTSVSAARGGLNSFGQNPGSVINNNTNFAASYTKNNMIADSAALFAAKLNKAAADILSGPIDFTTYGGFKTSGMTIAVDGTATGQGVAFPSKGIVGRNSTTTTFTIDSTTGDANFAGNITGSTGTFNGRVSSSIYGNLVTLNEASNNYFRVYDSGSNPIFSISGVSGAFANVRLNGADSLLGALSSTNSAGGPAIYGVNTSTGNGIYGNVTSSSAYGVRAAGVYGGNALSSDGKFVISSNAFVTNLYANYSYIMIGAASSATLYFYQGPTTGASTASFVGGNKPGGTSGNNQWLEFYINGVSYQIPVWAS